VSYVIRASVCTVLACVAAACVLAVVLLGRVVTAAPVAVSAGRQVAIQRAATEGRLADPAWVRAETAQLTQQVAALRAEVNALDPSPAMRHYEQQMTPADGRAEDADGSGETDLAGVGGGLAGQDGIRGM
jgi:hypothetical protein